MEEGAIKGKKVLVSGGLGFIGSNLVRKLVDRGALVTIADNRLPEHGANYYNLTGYLNRVLVNICDVRAPEFLPLLLETDVYFNLAAQTSHIGSLLDPFVDIDINARAQLSLLEYCRQNVPTIRIIFTSTRQVYGRPIYLPVNELHPLNPVDINGINKLAAEKYFDLYYEIYGLKTTILRLTNTYGPRMRIVNARLTFLGAWINNLLESEPVEVWDANIMRDFNYVDDVVDALITVAQEESAIGKTFNLGGEKTTLRDLSTLLVELWGGGEIDFPPYPAHRKKIEIGSIYSDYSRISEAFGWKPNVDLESGLRMTLDYYLQNENEYRMFPLK